MSINAVRGVEIGDGFAAAALRGEHNADPMRIGSDGAVCWTRNHAGGVLGGISTGQTLIARFAVKPTSSMATPVDSVDADGNEVAVSTGGRHDPCVGIRAVPVGEAMVACVLADHLLRHRGQNGLGTGLIAFVTATTVADPGRTRQVTCNVTSGHSSVAGRSRGAQRIRGCLRPGLAATDRRDRGRWQWRRAGRAGVAAAACDRADHRQTGPRAAGGCRRGQNTASRHWPEWWSPCGTRCTRRDASDSIVIWPAA